MAARVLEESAQRVSDGVTELLRKQPFFGSLALRLPLRADRSRETLASDGHEIRYSPRWVAATDAHVIEAAMARVVMACALKHHTRRGERDPERWQLASQLVTHALIRDAGFTLPPDAEALDGVSVEEAYDRLPEPREDESGGDGDPPPAGGAMGTAAAGQPSGADDGDDESSGDGPDTPDGPGDDDDSGAPGDGDGQRQDGPDDDGRDGDGTSDAPASHDPSGTGEIMDAGARGGGDADTGESQVDVTAEEQAWDEAMHQAMNLARAEGKLPGGVEETVRNAHASTLDADHPVPCKIAANGNAGELSLAENVVRIAMHPADQVVAFFNLARSGATVAAIAARFGVTERLVEQRLRLGNAAPELLDAYRADEIDLETLKAFSVTTDHDRQRAVWEQVSAQGYRPSAWQVKRLLTEERVPAGAPMARFIGVDAYEAAGGPVLRDLFADEYEHGVWLENPALLIELAMKKLTAAADELSTRWKWAEAMADVDWSATARFGRIQPEPAEPTDEEKAEIEKLRTRHDELANMDDDEWTEALVEEADAIEPRLDQIEADIAARARFKPEDFSIAGCIATIGRDGTLQLIQGLVKPEDMPKPAQTADAGAATQSTDDGDTDAGTDAGRIAGPAMSTSMQPPKDREAEARKDAGVGIGLADDLRSIRTALVKAHLANDFEAAFDLMVFQLVRAVFARGYTASWHALDIAFNETADRPTSRTNDDDFAAWSPGEAMLADWSHYPFEWMEGDDDAACFAALRALPRADKEKLFAAAVARTVKGQLAFEHGARPELEATVARLDIDFASHVRPTGDMLWSRIRKDRILDVARQTLGTTWASARSKYKKADLAKAMEEAFAAGTPPVGIGATAHAAALAWTMPGFAAFDTGGADDDAAAEAAPAEKPADAPDASGDAKAGPADKPHDTPVAESIETPAPGTGPEQDAAALPDATSDRTGEAAPAAEPGSGETAEGPAKGNGRDVSTVAEGEAGPETVTGGGGGEDSPADPSLADAIDAMNAVPTADGGPRVIVQTVGPVNSHEPGDDPLEIPEFLRRVH